jgi:electron transport complex protein RnfD
LLYLAGVMIVTNWLLYGFMYGLKLLLIILVGMIITRETEILFYSHDKDIDRVQAKELIQKSYWKVTALIFLLIIPVGTPLWLTAVASIIATLLGKLLFGGFHHMVFHSSLVGYIFLTEGWPALTKGVGFATAFDNYLIDLLFNNDFFNKTLYIGKLFGESSPLFNPDSSTALQLMQDGSLEWVQVLSGFMPGITVSGIILVLAFLFLLVKKAIHYFVPVAIILTYVLTSFLFGGFDILHSIQEVFVGSFLFVVIFVSTDPITTPMSKIGKHIFAIVVGALTFFIRQGVTYEEGIMFAMLFMMMLTPMLNTTFKVKKKAPKKDKVGA